MAGMDDLFLAKRGAAKLIADLVLTLEETDPTIKERFLKRVKAAYGDAHDLPDLKGVQEMEIFKWTYEMISAGTTKT